MNFCNPPWTTIFLSQSEPHWSVILTGTLTPVIAALGLLIAFRQWRTARNKLKLDLYEKRLAVYEAAREAIGKIVTGGKTTNQIEMEFLVGIRGAKWLFDKKMVKYLNEKLWYEIIEIGTIQAELEGADPSPEKSRLIARRAEIKKRFNEHLNEIDEKFYPFLSLGH